MNRKAVFFKILGLLLIVVPFLYNRYTILRIMSVLFGIILIVIDMILEKKNIWKIMALLVISFISLIGVDYALAKYASHIPIVSYEVKSSNRVVTYNSFFYRIYNCNKTLIFDDFYKKNYVCDIILPEENVNSLLSHIVNNFKDYRHKFININGKISNITGSTSIAMQIYENTENSINGQVSFSENITLTILNNGNLKNVEDLKIYDTINVIGRIESIKNKGENKEIIMKDARIISRNNFKNYEISVIENKSCETDIKLLSKTEDYIYHTSCLDSIYVKYDENNIYDLGYVLTDKRMTFEMLIKNIEKQENEIEELYTLNEFNLIKCKNSNNIIIGSKNLNLDTNYCESFNVLENEEDIEGV